MGVVAAPAESPSAPARTARGMCGATRANRNHGRVPDPILLAVAHGESRWRLAIVDPLLIRTGSDAALRDAGIRVGVAGTVALAVVTAAHRPGQGELRECAH